VIDNGFYYDFSYKRPFTPEDLVAIEKKMAELAKKDEPVTRKVSARRGGGLLQVHRRSLQGRIIADPGRPGRVAVSEGISPTCAAARTCRRPAS
jgi:hypothetical protein